MTISKLCFNCEKSIEKPDEGVCPHCGAEFNLKIDEPNDGMYKQIDTAVNYKRAGEFKKSIKIYKQLNNIFPNNPIIYKSWAKALVASGNYDLGLEYFIKAKKLFEFLDNPEWNCKEFIDILTTEPRDSQTFLIFLKNISGTLNYKINYNAVIDHVDIAKNFDERKKTIIEHISKNKGNIITNGILHDYTEKYGKEALTPGIYARFGLEAMTHGDIEVAKAFFIIGSALRLTAKAKDYSSSELENIGRCLAMLMTQFRLSDNAHDIIFKATILAYIYLSHSIENNKIKSSSPQYAYMLRGLLFMDHKNQSVIQDIITELSIGQLVEPYIISDCYMAASDKKSVFTELLSKAEYLHEDLEDITIAGKDANEYTLEEIAKIGEGRHLLLFKILEKKYKNGDYDITAQELESILDTK